MNTRINIQHTEDGIALVTLSRADKHNALDMAMFEALDNTIKFLTKSLTVRAVVVSGDGEDFCTGLDIKAIMKNRMAALKLLFKWLPGQSNLAQRVSTGWRNIPSPVIFAIHGRCWGGGLQIALGGDFRFAHPSSSWSIMEARWGLIPDMGGSIAFRELLAKDQLLELAMTAKQIDGVEAKALKLITHLSENPLDDAITFAKTLIQTSPDALAANKKLYQKTWWSSARRALWLETYYQIKVLLGRNQTIAVKRATEKTDTPRAYEPRGFK